MKNILTLLLGLIAGTASFANSPTAQPAEAKTRVVMTTDHKIKFYAEPARAKGELTIRDAHGQAIYNSTVSLQKGLHQQFDFSDLSTGQYQLTLKTGNQTTTKTFVVQANPNESFVMQ